MPLPSTPVTVSDSPIGDSVKTHPSFVMVGFSRVSGSSGPLFGSGIQNNSFIRLTIVPGEQHWRCSENYQLGRTNPRLIEVDLSAAQFAELLTSMNVGSGVPGTMRAFNGQMVPGFIDTDNLHEQIKQDIQTQVKGVVDTAVRMQEELLALLADSKMPKTKQESIKAMAEKIATDLKANLPFIIDQYQEAAEKVRAKCAAEVDAIAAHALLKLGLEKLSEVKALAAGSKSDSAIAQQS